MDQRLPGRFSAASQLFQVGFLYTGLLSLFQQYGGDAVVQVAQGKDA